VIDRIDMRRLNIPLAAGLMICAIALVTAQHRARHAVQASEVALKHARALEIEWGRLQLEESTLSRLDRIERIALARLHLTVPTAEQVRLARAGEAISPGAISP
jgi:cell division protein FtsL